jgi:hypothetical protein
VLARQVAARDPREWAFQADCLFRDFAYEAGCLAMIHTLESAIDRLVFAKFGMIPSAIDQLYREIGVPSGMTPCDMVGTRFSQLANYYPELDVQDVTQVASLLASFNGNESYKHADSISGASGSWLESFCYAKHLHPFDAFDIVTAVDTASEFESVHVRLQQDRASVAVLLSCGHRWPLDFTVDANFEQAVDADGIIPMVAFSDDPTALDLVQKQLASRGIHSDRSGLYCGKPLDIWLKTEFFRYQTRQFQKRPIVWQIQSGSFSARRSPAFACLVYFHKLDIDSLPKLQSQYVGPLRQRLIVELRGITSVAVAIRSDRQENRRLELEEAIVELIRFEEAVSKVATAGFGSTEQLPVLRAFAIRDATLALKARWLRKLTELISRSALLVWRLAADQSHLHLGFSSWVSDAMSHLERHCAQVKPQALNQKSLTNDPNSRDLAALICPHADLILATSLSLACDAWWKPLDEAVFSPLKEQTKSLKAEQKQCEEELKADPEPTQEKSRELKTRVKEIKAELKDVDKQLKTQTAKAKQIREQIEQWRSPEPMTWGDWLAGQPLFDQISSLDHRRAPPTTIAEFIAHESLYAPDINDGVRVNIAPLQKAGLLAADVLAAKDLDKAIADRAEWRADERRWVREGKLPQPGWWKCESPTSTQKQDFEIVRPTKLRFAFESAAEYAIFVVIGMLQRSGGSASLNRLARAYSLLATPQLLVSIVPPELADLAKFWQNKYLENPVAGFFRDAIMELVRREQLDRDALRQRTVTLIGTSRSLSIEEWVDFDARIALAAADSNDLSEDLITSCEQMTGQIVLKLMAG